VWGDLHLGEVRDDGGTTVLRRYFGSQGFQDSGTNYFYTVDHLGSVREVIDQSSTLRARYDYDPFGRRTKLAGDIDADFGFTGHWVHGPSGLQLALHRAYDADRGRWLSEDPRGLADGLNLYAYVHNRPTGAVDPEGLAMRGPYICVAYKLHPRTVLEKAGDIYGYCLMLPICVDCRTGEEVLKPAIKVWVFAGTICPEYCGYFGGPGWTVLGRGLTFCKFAY